MSVAVASHPLVDTFGRRHTSLRLSVTDRCNLRCFYCMPETGAQFAPRATLLTFEEISRIARLLCKHSGINEIRLTGGEPLVRKDLPRLVRMLSRIEGLADLSLTTNAMLLQEFAEPLRAAGLKRLNISLDTLDEKRFEEISRRKGFDAVIAGIDAAIGAGYDLIRLNTTAIKGVTEAEIIPLIEFARSRNVQLRFIEFMPLDADRAWKEDALLSGQRIRSIIEESFGPMEPVSRPRASQPATDYRLVDGQSIGLIQSVSHPFCGACDRIRLTADGAIRNCLFSNEEFALRDRLRGGASDEELLTIFQEAVGAKKSGHEMHEASFQPPDRPMYSIGG